MPCRVFGVSAICFKSLNSKYIYCLLISIEILKRNKI